MEIYKKDDIVTGKVTGIEGYGVFLSFDNGYTGLIHISEISKSFVRNVNDFVELNEEIKARVIDIDENNKKLKLSLIGVDYRKNHKNRQGIIETNKGFSTLRNCLDDWILSKIDKK